MSPGKSPPANTRETLYIAGLQVVTACMFWASTSNTVKFLLQMGIKRISERYSSVFGFGDGDENAIMDPKQLKLS